MTRNPPDALAEMLRAMVAEEVARQVAKLAPTPLLTIAEAAVRANASPATIRRWLDRGLLAPRGVGRAVRVDAAELDALLATPRQRRRARPAPTANLTPEQLAERRAGVGSRRG